MKMFIIFLMMFLSFIMFFLNHPLMMGLMILLQTLLVCVLSGMLIKTYWFSYILFLTFLGGLLVLFIYVTSIASNELFKLNFNFKMTLFFIFLTMILYILLNNSNFMIFNNLEMNNFINIFAFLNNENSINLSKLYNNQTFLLIMMMIIYLFITLIAVIKITNIFYGPLRTSSN
uniref:NADH-ubiquinone oxidoreductase chain 6 n=1 Tax=Pyralis farinalis TaxID=687122 RepID=A0A6H0DQ90_9NEOP|nr:NADH dehydrogenase subunit 6 [Pyralis farinalis]QIS91162.1 NADH dehydrogenase subunit 6 [Pyralis farinalis]